MFVLVLMEWGNWAGTVSCEPRRAIAPRDTEDVVRLITGAATRGWRLRPVGSGHSFTPLVRTDDTLVSLHRLSGVRAVKPLDDGGALVTVGGGTTLGQLNAELAGRGLALANLGDIDKQSIAGAIGTGTHGTGARLPGLSAQVMGIELVDGTGRVRRATAEREPEVFQAGRLSLGALGIVTEVTLRTVPAYVLAAREEPARLSGLLETLDVLVSAHDHLEFFWFPHTDWVQLKRSDVVAGPPRPLSRPRTWWEERVVENGLFGAANALGRLAPAAIPAINEASGRLLSRREYSDWSYRAYCTRRDVRFKETEWAIPRGRVRFVLAQLADWIASHRQKVSFPIEVRFAAADDVWLSTAYGQDVAYVAAHTYWRRDNAGYFDAVAQICTEVGGRPHWGKMHPLGSADLKALYPRFEGFRAERDRLDPGRMFSNDYVEHLLD